MAEGYIKLYRKIQEHQLWSDKPFSKGQAWVDLLLMANHKETKFLLGNEIVSAEAGQIVTSEIKLSERWGWSRCKVRSFLELLQKDSMLLKKSDSKKTSLTLCNYSVYNETETAKKHQKNSVKTAFRQRLDTIKNEENEENEENKENIREIDVSPLQNAVYEFQKMRQEIKAPMTDNALRQLYGKLQTMAPDDDAKKIAILEQSIFNNWKGVFDLKAEKKETARKSFTEIIREAQQSES